MSIHFRGIITLAIIYSSKNTAFSQGASSSPKNNIPATSFIIQNPKSLKRTSTHTASRLFVRHCVDLSWLAAWENSSSTYIYTRHILRENSFAALSTLVILRPGHAPDITPAPWKDSPFEKRKKKKMKTRPVGKRALGKARFFPAMTNSRLLFMTYMREREMRAASAAAPVLCVSWTQCRKFVYLYMRMCVCVCTRGSGMVTAWLYIQREIAIKRFDPVLPWRLLDFYTCLPAPSFISYDTLLCVQCYTFLLITLESRLYIRTFHLFRVRNVAAISGFELMSVKHSILSTAII